MSRYKKNKCLRSLYKLPSKSLLRLPSRSPSLPRISDRLGLLTAHLKLPSTFFKRPTKMSPTPTRFRLSTRMSLMLWRRVPFQQSPVKPKLHKKSRSNNSSKLRQLKSSKLINQCLNQRIAMSKSLTLNTGSAQSKKLLLNSSKMRSSLRIL